MNTTNPIGLFDSGVGGTSIWKEIHALLPNENTLYLADSKNAPYGSKSAEEIIELSHKNTEKLLEENCKIIVVACNTATTNAIEILRQQYSVPFIGIEPAIKPAALLTETKSIGILATKGTLSSALFHKTAETFTKDISIVEIVGEGLVPLIEKGKWESPETKELLQQYLTPMLDANIDHLVLGCSHYPYLIPTLKKLLPSHIKIIDSGEAVARQTKTVLKAHWLLNDTTQNPRLQFFTNGNMAVLEKLLPSHKAIEISEMDF
ncbi:glutamate racemase [Flavobacteriaceae bacterium TK19130]|nr:glutamate racemase [Thermobacterium salinum]